MIFKVFLQKKNANLPTLINIETFPGTKTFFCLSASEPNTHGFNSISIAPHTFRLYTIAILSRPFDEFHLSMAWG